MDIFSDILDKLSLKSSFYYRASLTGEWGVNMPKDKNMARFHIVVEGDFWLKVQGSTKKVKASTGDIIVVFHGKQHSLVNKQKTRPLSAKVFLEQAEEHIQGRLLRYKKGEGQTTNIICGHFYFENDYAHPVVKSLPDLLHIKKEDNSHSPWLGTILDFIDFESKVSKPGARTLIKKLTEIIFIQAIRVYLEKNHENSTALNLISDQYISQSMEAIHNYPEKKWTLESLASIAGLSRTVYCKRFKKISGLTPYAYLTSLRMEKASNLLKQTGKSTGEIADIVGYQTDEHFQKAFKKETGITPSKFRKDSA